MARHHSTTTWRGLLALVQLRFGMRICRSALDRMDTAPHPDAELIRLGRELEAAWAAERAAWIALHEDDSPEADAQSGAAYNRCDGIVDAIEAEQAATLDGVLVQARAVAWIYDGDDFELPGGTTDQRIACQIVRDLIRLDRARA